MKYMYPPTKSGIALLGALLAFVLPTGARAADSTWTGDADQTSWFDSGNWTGDVIAGADSGTTNIDYATFNLSSSTSVNFGSYLNLRRILVGSSAGNYIFTGTDLHLTGGNSTALSAQIYRGTGNNGTTAINANITLNPGTAGTNIFSFENHSSQTSSTMHINGNVTGGTTAGSYTLRLTGLSSSGSNEVNGVISNGGAAGGISVEKTNSARWMLNAANTYTGTTTVTGGGILGINNSHAIGTGLLLISNTVTIGNYTDSAITLTSNNTQRWNSNFTFSGTSNLNMGTGAVSLGTQSGATRSVSVDTHVITIGGVISDGTHAETPTQNILKTGTGTFRLNGDNEYTGTTTVSAGSLLVNGAHSGGGAYSVANGATLGGAGTIETAGNAGVSLSAGAKLSPGDITGTGTLTMNLGTGVLDISAAVAAGNSQSLFFTLGGVASSDRIVLSNIQSGLAIGDGNLEFDDFFFGVTGGFGAGTYTLFNTGQIISGTLGGNLSGIIGGMDASLSLSGDNHSILLSVVPEPEMNTLLLVAIGFAAIASGRRIFRRS